MDSELAEDPEAEAFTGSRPADPSSAFAADRELGGTGALTSSSLFFNGFATFDQIQDEMINDVLSDDEDQAQRAERKKKKELLQQQAKDDDDGNQIDSGAPAKQAGSSTMFNQIMMDIDMLLDSDDDDYEKEMKYQDDAMIEKDLDNWI